MRRHSKTAGFSLIELMVTIIVVAVTAAVIMVPVISMADTLVWDRLRTDLVDSSRHSFDRVFYEIQNIAREEVNGITAAQSDNLKFRTPEPENEARRIYRNIASNRLLLQSISTVGTWESPLSIHLNDLNISYYDRDGVVLTPGLMDFRKIVTIRFQAHFKSTALGLLGMADDYFISTEIQPRNISDREHF